MNRETTAATGWCERCGCSHSLPVGESAAEALRLRGRILAAGTIALFSAAIPTCSAEVLYGRGRGKMFGVLETRDTRGRQHFLYAFSGLYNGLREVPGWVPPVTDKKEFNRIYRNIEPEIKAISEKIFRCEKAEQRSLHKQRRALSRRLNRELRQLCHLRNFRGESATLEELFAGRGIPSGTGDCCTPKLLHAAACRDLQPVSLCEFFIGKKTASGSCRDGEFYPPCTAKCVPLLGFLLCGIKEAPPDEDSEENNHRAKTHD